MEYYQASPKGTALLLAIDCGLIRRHPIKGYNIGPFMRFWDELLPILQRFDKKNIYIPDMLYEKSDDTASN